MRHKTLEEQVLRRHDEPTLPPLRLPAAHCHVLPGVRWGRHDCLFTPAYWAAQAWHHAAELTAAPLRLGRTLVEEVAACLLGGHGTPAEIGLAAFESVRRAGLLVSAPASAADVEAVLARPLLICGRTVRYRFARQRAIYLASALSRLSRNSIDSSSHRRFRDELTSIHGIGLKTASWITRNWLDSDEVAVLDVHVLRAGCIMGLFPHSARIDRDYLELEDAYISFARAISVRASRLDALIWRQMRFAGILGIRAAARALKRSTESDMLPAAA